MRDPADYEGDGYDFDAERDVRIIWKCGQCGTEREEPVGYNEGGHCSCGGVFQKAGESYLA